MTLTGRFTFTRAIAVLWLNEHAHIIIDAHVGAHFNNRSKEFVGCAEFEFEVQKVRNVRTRYEIENRLQTNLISVNG